MNKITVIMPVWNGMPFLRKAISSVINQRYKNWQLIISDDGSTDGTVDYLKKIKNKKIKIFYQKKNLGIFGNLKFLNSKSNTSLVKIFCQDDRMYKNCLKRTYDFMTKFDDCKLMSCNKFQHYKNILGRHYYIYEQLGNKEFIKFPPKASMIAFFTLGNICGNLSQVTYKKFNNKYFPSFQKKITIAGDYYAWAKYSYKYGTYIIPDKLVYVRTHAKKASNYLNMKNDYYLQLPIVYEYLLNRIKKKYYPVLRKDMILFNLPQRITNFIKYLLIGRIRFSLEVFSKLPFNISILELFIYGIFYRFKNNKFNFLNKYYTKQVVNIIKENL